MLQAFYTATVGAQQQMERMGVQGKYGQREHLWIPGGEARL